MRKFQVAPRKSPRPDPWRGDFFVHFICLPGGYMPIPPQAFDALVIFLIVVGAIFAARRIITDLNGAPRFPKDKQDWFKRPDQAPHTPTQEDDKQ
jgi:hypothetical protein